MIIHCNKCEVELDDANRASRGKRCKACHAIVCKAWRDANPVKYMNGVRDRMAKNRLDHNRKHNEYMLLKRLDDKYRLEYNKYFREYRLKRALKNDKEN